MKVNAKNRILISSLIAFIFYAIWAWFANHLVTMDIKVLTKAALVQGGYSAIITMSFTWLLELFFKRLGLRKFCLPFIVPLVPLNHPDEDKTNDIVGEAINMSKNYCKGNCLPGAILAPLPAIVVQAALVIVVNYSFNTPNLWLTVAPSIVFSAIFGYVYSFSLSRKDSLSKVTNS